MLRSVRRVEVGGDPEDVVWDERLGAEISLYGRDRGTRERRRRGEVIEVGWRGVRHAEDVHASPLAYYGSRGLLSDSPYKHKHGEENTIRGLAAVRLLRDWERGGRRPRVTGRYDGMPVGRPGVAADGVWADWGPWAAAYEALGWWGDCVQSVVCFDEWAGDWARRRYPRMAGRSRIGMACLRLGLSLLVDWYEGVDRGRRYL